MSRWLITRLDAVAPEVRSTFDPSALGDTEVEYYSIPALDSTGSPEVVPASEILSLKQRLEGGEVMVSRLNPRKARVVAVAPLGERVALASGEFVVLQPRRVDRRFLTYVLLSESTRQFLDAHVQSVTRSHQRIRPEHLLKMPLSLPSPAQQRAIADYLDTETTRIDALITKKRRMIEVLDERRTEAIAQAVTAGFEADRPMVPTGNPFAPEMPVGWKLHRLRHVVDDIVDTAHKTAPVVDDGEFLVVRTANVKKGDLVLGNAVYTDEAGWREWTERGVPAPGDVMFTREAPAGEACVVPPDMRLCIGQRMVLIRVSRQKLSGEWLVHSIYAGAAQRFIEILSRSTTVAHLNMSDIPDIPVVVPPLSEQESILARLRRTLEIQEESTRALERQIDLLVERRQALITAVVTGELSVPGVAA